MKVKKIITQDEELDITEATLLTTEEAEMLPHRLRNYKNQWWLRSPGYSQNFVAYVSSGGPIIYGGLYVCYSEVAVRPALKIRNLESSNLTIGDTFVFHNKRFEVIDAETAFCLEDIDTHRFCPNRQSNDYETSDVKKYVDDWFNGVK